MKDDFEVIADKEFIAKFKLIFSSLFRRVMPYMIVGIPELKDNQTIFTNIPATDIVIYEHSTEDFLHLVTLNDEKFYNALIKLFPVFKDYVAVIDIRVLGAALNKASKNKAPWETVKIYQLNDKLMLEFTPEPVVDPETLEIKNDITRVCVCIGQVLTEFVVTMYYDLYKTGLVSQDVDPYIVKLTAEELPTTTYDIIEVYNHPLDTLKDLFGVRAVVNDSRNMFSTKEFIKKYQPEGWYITAYVGGEKSALRMMTTYTSDLIDIVSVQPGMKLYSKYTALNK